MTFLENCDIKKLMSMVQKGFSLCKASSAVALSRDENTFRWLEYFHQSRKYALQRHQRANRQLLSSGQGVLQSISCKNGALQSKMAICNAKMERQFTEGKCQACVSVSEWEGLLLEVWPLLFSDWGCALWRPFAVEIKPYLLQCKNTPQSGLDVLIILHGLANAFTSTKLWL